MAIIEFILENRISDAAIELRRQSFPKFYHTGKQTDEFDVKSHHISVLSDGELAFYTRLVPGPNSAFEKWMERPNDIPFSGKSIDINRLCVNQKYRGRSMIRLGFRFSLLLGGQLGYQYALGGVEEGNAMLKICLAMGMAPLGKLLHWTEVDDLLVQPLLLDLENQKDSLKDEFSKHLNSTSDCQCILPKDFIWEQG